MKWNEPVEISEQLGLIEIMLGCNIYILDIDNLPMLNTTANIYDSVMYKSTYNIDYKQCWLLLDNSHYNSIVNIKSFLACRCFCNKCLSTFTHQESFEKHTCEVEDKTIEYVNNATFHKDSAHY